MSSGDTWIARGLCLGPAWHLGAFPTLCTSVSPPASALEQPLHPRWSLLSLMKVCLCLPPTPGTSQTPLCCLPAPSCCLCITFQPWWLSQLPSSVNADCLVYYFYFSFLSLCLSYECVPCMCRSECVETRGRFWGSVFSFYHEIRGLNSGHCSKGLYSLSHLASTGLFLGNYFYECMLNAYVCMHAHVYLCSCCFETGTPPPQ